MVINCGHIDKNNVKTETYVKLPRSIRSAVARFRRRYFPLAIETGRYARPQTPLHDRRCRLCDGDKIENEKHFLTNCSLYNDIQYDLIIKAKIVYIILTY